MASMFWWSIAMVLAADTQAPPDLSLKGYILAADGSRSIAVLAGEGRTRVVAVGETVFGGTLVSVGPEGAVVDFGGSRLLVTLSGPKPASPAPPAPLAAPDRDNAAAVPATPTRVLVRADITRRLGEEMPRILGQASLRPFVEAGHVVGMELVNLPAGTLLTEVGLQDGDVLTELNGTHIDGLPTLVALYGKLQQASELRATLVRGGRIVTIALTIQ